jgi:hypothetical protein
MLEVDSRVRWMTSDTTDLFESNLKGRGYSLDDCPTLPLPADRLGEATVSLSEHKD